MKKVQTIIFSIAAMIGLVTLPLVPATVLAEGSPVDSIQDGVTKVGGTKTGQTDLTDLIKIIVNIMLFILGAIAVIMIIIGGIRYTTSNGEAANTKAAKDTILYAVIGLVVAILAYAIVNFVLDAFKSR
jgi:multisubunit Na+/H+ antiporter MnhB subunit